MESHTGHTNTMTFTIVNVYYSEEDTTHNKLSLMFSIGNPIGKETPSSSHFPHSFP